MLPARKILFPTDFSPTADVALDHALLLAGTLGAELHLLHAHVLFDDDPEGPRHRLPERQTLLARLEELAKLHMTRLGAKVGGLDVAIVHAEDRGYSASGSILDYVADHGIDLVVMGSHGRRGVGRWVIGSVASQVVHHATCPVLVVREETGSAVRKVKSILLPTDFSEASRRAVKACRHLADALGARVVLLHAIDIPSYPDFYGVLPPSLTPDMEQAATKDLEALWGKVGGPAVPHRIEIRQGRASRIISRVAEELDSDWIAMAPHGAGAVDRVVFGSTTEAMLRHAPRPLLVLAGLHDA